MSGRVQPGPARAALRDAAQPRDGLGRFGSRPALERFAEKCRFEPATGCVLWTGGTTSGHLKTLAYGSFWDGGRRWFAHRWAASHIHGLDIAGLQVDHCCPGGPNTLCVQHLQAVTQTVNLELQWGRRLWGWDEWEASAPDAANDGRDVPFHLPPAWLRPFMVRVPPQGCPF